MKSRFQSYSDRLAPIPRVDLGPLLPHACGIPLRQIRSRTGWRQSMVSVCASDRSAHFSCHPAAGALRICLPAIRVLRPDEFQAQGFESGEHASVARRKCQKIVTHGPVDETEIACEKDAVLGDVPAYESYSAHRSLSVMGEACISGKPITACVFQALLTAQSGPSEACCVIRSIKGRLLTNRDTILP